MKILITGSRDWDGGGILPYSLGILTAWYYPDILFIHGAARGVDAMVAALCADYNIPVHAYPAPWSTHGKAAGPIRNRLMLSAEHPDLVIGFTDNWAKSKGTKDMIRIAREAKVETYLYHQVGGWDPVEPPWMVNPIKPELRPV